MTTNGDPIVREIYIEARPETVFEFFVDPEKITRWLAAEATHDPRPGGACLQVHAPDADRRFHMRGEFLEVEPPNRIVFTWGFTEPEVGVPPGSSTVEVTLRPVDAGTSLRLVHHGLPAPAIADHAPGWTGMLDVLARAVTGADPSTVDAIRHEVWINADRAAVFAALTTEDGLNAWWPKASGVEASTGTVLEFDHGLGAPLLMRITRFGPDSHVSWLCESHFSDPANPASDWFGTELTFELSDGARTGFGPVDAGVRGQRVTILNFRHSAWHPGARWFPFCNYAWGVTLENVAKYCEGTLVGTRQA